MVRPKRAKTGESFSARPEEDDDYVPPTEVEEQPREGSRVGASFSGARATSLRGRRQSGSDQVVLGIPDTPLLRDLGGHISAISQTQERCSWKPVLTFYQRASPSLRDALGRNPLGPFLTIPRIQSDRRLDATLCERWFGETNTFHFPCCELAITPLDFVMLTGIPIVGEVIPPLSVIPMDRAAGLMGVSPETVVADSGWEAGKVKLSWLASILEATAIAVIDLNSPAFTSVLWTSFLPLMDPIDRFDTFDWGGAIYASILAGLRRVSRGEGRSVRFFYHFLEMWAHEYLDPFCPSLKIPDVTSFPQSSRWSSPSSKVDSHLLDKARKELDYLTLRRVTLQPFSDFDDMIQLFCRGESEFFTRAMGSFGLHLPPPPEMTPVLAPDTFMEGMCTAGVPIHHLVETATCLLEEDNRALIEENARLRDRCATLEDPLVTLEAIPPYQDEEED
ncbi:hypothetical protein HHK36_019742 [Tetracentron sinense]|uniref:Aminotransferase-like plant mobile domain-containing protein n=1 Tax=Tetracentron sinense TaxID=13715 RepID=A0A835DAB5_TETSI|nr:hypothetical protein HHK36_019742 [Tetracentron sinense]